MIRREVWGVGAICLASEGSEPGGQSWRDKPGRGGVTACPSGVRTVPPFVKVQVLYSVWSSDSVRRRYRKYCIPKRAKCQTAADDMWEP